MSTSSRSTSWTATFVDGARNAAAENAAEGVTVHGFRSTFRDWCGNRASTPRELAEHALSPVIGDKVEQAYRRDDALERRRPLMEFGPRSASRVGKATVSLRGAIG